MDTPNYLDIDEKQEESRVESSVQASEKKLEPAKSLNFQKPKSEIATLENAATKFPSFILPSLQKARVFREVPKYPRVEEDLFATNSSGYVLDLDKSKNPTESIGVWIGALYQMQVVSRLDNISIFALAEKRMAGIVYDWWMGPSEEERMNVAAAGLATLELLLKTQFVPEPADEKKKIITDLARMELKDVKF